MHRRIPALALIAALVLTACGGTAVEPRLETVDAATFAGAIDGGNGLVIVDLRTPVEFAAGHIPGAINLDYYETSFRTRLDALDKDAPYAVYCRSGNRSTDTLQIMTDLGFTDVRELGGGIITWVEAGLPLGY